MTVKSFSSTVDTNKYQIRKRCTGQRNFVTGLAFGILSDMPACGRKEASDE